MTRAKIIQLHPRDGNAAMREIHRNAIHDPMLPNDITEELIEASRQRAREMVFAIVVYAFAIIGASWTLGYLVGMVTK